MNPLHLSLRNVRTFDEFDLDLPEGLLAILGSNGAGKSTIINAIDVALFGSRTLGDWYPRGGGEEPLVITLTFEHSGETYRVRRSYSPKGRGQTKTDLETMRPLGAHDEAEYWEPLTVESQSATNDQIESLIGITRDTFRASSFLAQGDTGAFCEAQPRARKAILADAIGLDQWDAWLERSRLEKKVAQSALDKIVGSLESAEEDLSERSLIEEEREQAVEQRQQQETALAETLAALTTAREALANAERQAERRAAAERAVQAADRAVLEWKDRIEGRESEIKMIDVRLAERADLQAVAGQLVPLAREKDALITALDQWSERVRFERNLAQTTTSAEVSLAAAQELDAKAATVIAGVDEEKCDRCGQTLHAEAAERAAQSFRADAETQRQLAQRQEDEAKELAEKLTTLPSEQPDELRLPLLERSLANAQNANARLAALIEAAARRDQAQRELDEMRAELSAHEQSLGAARADAAEFGPQDSAKAEAEIAVAAFTRAENTARSALAHSERIVAAADTKLERLDKIAADVQRSRARRDELNDELDLLSSMEKACGPNGVPALILETVAIPQVETEATRILGLLGGPAYACELRTLRETKTGSLSDTLDIMLLTETGEAPYESFSGGERARIAFALRLALSQLLASRKGSATGLLVIDELEGLDAQGIASLVTVLEDLQRSVPRIIVVSHNAELRDAFEQTVMLEQLDGRSRVVQEVAA